MGSITAPKRVLLLTNSEHGQANVFLATSHALLTLEDEDVEVHFASFPPIQQFVSATSDHAQRDRPGARAIVFHTIDGVDMVSAWSRPEIAAERQAVEDRRSIFSLTHAIRRTLLLLKVTLPWTGPEFVQILRSVIDIVHGTQPDIIAVDPAFSPALTALRHIKAKFVVLSPNTIKDFAMPFQPNGEALWRYPCTGTAHPYPLPPFSLLMLKNTLQILISLLVAIFDPTRRALVSYLAVHVPGARLTTLADLSLNGAALGTKFLVANLPEIEFPLKVIPRHVVPCGPMLRPTGKVGEGDGDLAGWLAFREGGGENEGGRERKAKLKVLYINLGTHVFFDEEMARETALAVRRLLDAAREVGLEGIKVLWKMPTAPRFKDEDGEGGGMLEPRFVAERVLGEEMKKGVVRVVEWIQAEPMAVLESGSVVCAVHHGGANSFLEAVRAGVPQVVLPLWLDTYDFARRAEILEIGRWGNMLADGKLCEASELGSILVDVVVGERSSTYAQKAGELAELCRRSGGGSVIAARHILAEIGSNHQELPSEGEKETGLLLGK